LPSELEWEKAARGGLPDAVFSWGDTPDPNRANYADSGIGDTAAVGCFPANGFGLHDTIGNVWEWTRSLWVAYPYDPGDPKREDLDAGNDESRAVRGGSWDHYRGYARCASRYGSPAGVRGSHIGFGCGSFRTTLRPVTPPL
jgi:formylglycine-generating enzyme required for sulfatase activity